MAGPHDIVTCQFNVGSHGRVTPKLGVAHDGPVTCMGNFMLLQQIQFAT